MKPHLLKVSPGPSQSFSIRHDRVPHLNNLWHYHQEIELIHINEGAGVQFVGDSINRFSSGSLLLIGSNLSHYWRFDDAYFDENPKVSADIRVAHFCADVWGERFLNLPENKHIQATLEKAKLGLQIKGRTAKTVSQLLEDSLMAEGAKRIILLLEILHLISRCDQVHALSSQMYKTQNKLAEEERINSVYAYSFANFNTKITTEEISSVANLSPTSFCRYFKSIARKTYSQFLTEIRVGNACKLIRENRLDMKQICYESGFNNLTSFHKSFKMITGSSPMSYQKAFFNK